MDYIQNDCLIGETMKSEQEGLWFIEKGSIGIYTRKNHIALKSIEKGYKTARIKAKNHIFYYH